MKNFENTKKAPKIWLNLIKLISRLVGWYEVSPLSSCSLVSTKNQRNSSQQKCHSSRTAKDCSSSAKRKILPIFKRKLTEKLHCVQHSFSIASLTFGLKVASCVRFSSMKQLTSFASRRMKHSNYAVRHKWSHGEFLAINVSPFLSSLRHNMGGLLVYPMPLSFVLFLMESKTIFFCYVSKRFPVKCDVWYT